MGIIAELEQPVAETLLRQVLSCYKANAVYLRSAAVRQGNSEPLISARGDFIIPESCYIDDTGHFNAVEFNICVNQIGYVTIAQSILNGWLPDIGIQDYVEYLDRQLPDFLILELTSRFKAPINARCGFGAIFEVLKIRPKRNVVFMRGRVRFDDSEGGHAEGELFVGLVDSRGRQKVHS